MREDGSQVVVHIITRFVRAGSDENTLLSCNGQAALGNKVYLIVGQDHDPAMVSKLDSSVELVVCRSLAHPIKPLSDAFALFGIWRLLRKINPTIVHTHNSKAGVVGRVAAYLLSTPVVHTVHIIAFVGVSAWKRVFYKKVEQLLSSITSSYIFVSEGLRKEFISSVPGAGSRLNAVVLSGMEVERFTRVREGRSGKELNSVVGRTAKLVAIGMIEDRKRMRELVQSMISLSRFHPNLSWELRIAGEGSLLAELQAKVEASGLSEQVMFSGYVENVAVFLAEADLLIHASHVEGLPRVVIQALASGVPVVCHALPGIKETLSHAHNVWVVEEFSDAAFVSAIAQVLGDQELLSRLRGAAMEFDARPWSSEYMVEGISEVYERVLSTEA